MAKKSLWEILIPNFVPNTQNKKLFTLKYHKGWDFKVCEIAEGLTIMKSATGNWINANGKIIEEKMTPIRIVASKKEINLIIDMTLQYYNQEEVLCYRLSNKVIVKSKNQLAD